MTLVSQSIKSTNLYKLHKTGTSQVTTATAAARKDPGLGNVLPDRAKTPIPLDTGNLSGTTRQNDVEVKEEEEIIKEIN